MAAARGHGKARQPSGEWPCFVVEIDILSIADENSETSPNSQAGVLVSPDFARTALDVDHSPVQVGEIPREFAEFPGRRPSVIDGLVVS
jgi:hypothetical protein